MADDINILDIFDISVENGIQYKESYLESRGISIVNGKVVLSEDNVEFTGGLDTSVIRLDMQGNIIESSTIPAFARTRAEAKKLLGSSEKISENEWLMADSLNKRAIIVDISLNKITWEYKSDRYVVDCHLVPQNDVTISVYDGSISETPLFIRNGTTVIWKNESSAPISIYSGTTTYDEFYADPDLEFYGNTFESETLNVGETYTFKFTSNNTYDWFVYPTILTGKIEVTTNRMSNRDQYIIVESDCLESPFSSRVIRVDSYGNVLYSFGENFLVKPRDARPLLNNNVLIST